MLVEINHFKKMKILIVSAYFYPDIEPRSFRTTGLVEELYNQGHEITLCIPYRDFDYTNYLEKIKISIVYLTRKSLSIKMPNGDGYIAKIVRLLYSKFNFYTLYPHIKLIISIPKLLSKHGNYNLMISIAAPHVIHWGCVRAIKKNQNLCNKWIADCGDPFMGDQTQRRPSYFKGFESSFCRNADFITVPFKNAIDAYDTRYKYKIRVIPQGFDFSIKSKFIKTQVNDCPTFAYAGAFYGGYRDPTAFLDYLSIQSFNFRFVLYTSGSKLLYKYKRILGEKLEIYDYIPREDLMNVLSQMDFLINFENKGSVQSPSKLIDYALVNRPVFNVNMDQINKKSFVDFINGDYSDAYVIQNIEQYDIKSVAREFLEL